MFVAWFLFYSFGMYVGRLFRVCCFVQYMFCFLPSYFMILYIHNSSLLKLCHEACHLFLQYLQLGCCRFFHFRIQFRYTIRIVQRHVLTLTDIDFNIRRCCCCRQRGRRIVVFVVQVTASFFGDRSNNRPRFVRCKR